jgi:hypothetical protein
MISHNKNIIQGIQKGNFFFLAELGFELRASLAKQVLNHFSHSPNFIKRHFNSLVIRHLGQLK